MKRAVLIKPGGYVEPVMLGVIVNTHGGDKVVSELTQMQNAVGGYLQEVGHSHPNLVAYMDEDGIRKGLAPNELASAIFFSGGDQRLPILGNVLVLGRLREDGEVEGLTVEQANIFLSPEGEDILNALVEADDEQGLDHMEDAFGGELP